MNEQSQVIINAATSLDGTLTQNSHLISDQAAQIQKLGEQLAAVTADDQSVGAQLLASQARLGRVMQLAKPNMALNLHRLPSTQDPNARPIMTWFQPGNTGNTGGGSTAKHGTWAITQMADHAEFAIVPAQPFDNYFWALNLLKSAAPFSRYLQVTEFEVPDEALPLAMGVETNWERSTGSSRINAGIQALLGTDKDQATGQLVTNQWRYYDISAGHWAYSGIPLDRTMFGTGKRIQLVSEFAESSGGMQNVSLTINGAVHPINKFTKALQSNWGPYLQAGFQMDCLQSAKPFTVKVWNQEAYWL
jgi:hypothetical protein